MQKKVAGPIPPWAWVFVVLCALIPIITLGGALPAALGAGGASGCAAVARDPSRPVGVRVALCVGITGVCWVIFVLLLGTVIVAKLHHG